MDSLKREGAGIKEPQRASDLFAEEMEDSEPRKDHSRRLFSSYSKRDAH